jgi:competence protein ComGC
MERFKCDEISRGGIEMNEMIRNQKGFRLIEVMIAFIILAVGLLGMAGLQITPIKGNSCSSQVTQGSILAQNKLQDSKQTSRFSGLRTQACSNRDARVGRIEHPSLQILLA